MKWRARLCCNRGALRKELLLLPHAGLSAIGKFVSWYWTLPVFAYEFGTFGRPRSNSELAKLHEPDARRVRKIARKSAVHLLQLCAVPLRAQVPGAVCARGNERCSSILQTRRVGQVLQRTRGDGAVEQGAIR